MARYDARRREKSSKPARHDQPKGAPVLSALVRAMNWRLRESAVRIGEVEDALAHQEHERAMERLFDLEPLLFDAQRILSAAFVIAREGKENNGAADRDE